MVAMALIALATLATVSSAVQQRKAAKAERKATEAQNRIQQRRSQREKLDQLRQARIQAAIVANQAGVAGTAGSSSSEGMLSSISSQYGNNVNFIDQNMQDATASMFAMNEAAKYSTQANTSSAIAGLSMSAAGQFGKTANPAAATPAAPTSDFRFYNTPPVRQ